MNFGMALFTLQLGRRVTNRNWNGQGMYLELQVPDKDSANNHPYIFMRLPATHPVYSDARIPWLPSQLDLFSESWEILKKETEKHG